MSTTDFIALAAVAVSAIALVANFFVQMAAAQSQARFQGQVQKQIETLKEQFAAARELRQYILPDMLADIKIISQWIDKGYQLADASTYKGIRGSKTPWDSWRQDIAFTEGDYDQWQSKFRDVYFLAEKYGALMQTADKVRLPPVNHESVYLSNLVMTLFLDLHLLRYGGMPTEHINTDLKMGEILDLYGRATTELETIRSEAIKGTLVHIPGAD